ncbi:MULTISPECIES: EcsC family protein [Stenotrophomonas]|uniref:EcsC family protein n=2 Tax=Gammaproteobacteria TaxID=1236 RepID=UPI000C25C29D|nr:MULTISPECIES: EcsC family protein [Stenotrophomonas]MCU1002258.1 EcsC family protein [Stenotrophomonas maltophilia]MCU1066558.1 EcsC family protein [Stenotrophomonas maltophilia]MCU1076235.1 EcsC family protein [Stenotrophomonas maltophilia]PJL60810.1 ATPase [Stenotrophomonas maltophilia]
MQVELTPYEQQQWKAIVEWKNEEPSVISQTAGKALAPVSWLIGKVVPEAAMRGILDLSSSAAEWLTDTGDLTRDAGVSSLNELKTLGLQRSDELADEVHNWAIGMAGAEGAATGAAGIFGIAADIPMVLVLALRTIHKIGACYGFEAKSKEDKDFMLAILSASSANEMAEKTAALTTLRMVQVSIAKTTWKKLAEKAATDRFSKEAGVIAVKTLAKQLGINMTKRKALQAIPAIGAVVGGSVNAWYLKEIGWSARHAFQERWLLENGRALEDAELAVVGG